MATETLETLPQTTTTGPVHPHIEKRADVLGGQPIIAGTRIPVRVIAVWHRMGYSVDEIVAMYARLNHAPAFDALSYYYDHKSEIEQLIADNDIETVRRKHEGNP